MPLKYFIEPHKTPDSCLDTEISEKIFAKEVKEYTEKILSHIPELDPDIEVVKLNVQEDHVHMVV